MKPRKLNNEHREGETPPSLEALTVLMLTDANDGN